MPFTAKPVQVEAAPDGQTLVIATSTGLVLTSAAHPLSASLPPGRYHRPSVSRDGRLLAVPRNGVEVIVVDLATGRVVRVLKKGGDQLERPFFDASGRLYVGRARWDGDLWMADLDG